jgi:hypothetical protein
MMLRWTGCFVSMTSDGQSVSESAAIVRYPTSGESKPLSGYRDMTCDACLERVRSDRLADGEPCGPAD